MTYIREILDNNINIVMVPLENTQIVTMGFFIKAGSRNETEENSGVAHFLEHLMFKGTSNRTANKLFEELDTLGTVYNAATTSQYTYYYIYGNSEDVKHILDIMLDIYINVKFDAKEINKEKKVIIEEMRMRSDAPMMKLYSKMNEKIFSGTSLARPIIGSTETVLSLGRKDFIKFRDSLYKPENTVFVITGNFSPKPIYKLLKHHLAPLKNSPETPVTYFQEKAVLMENMKRQFEPYIYLNRNDMFQQMYVLLAFPMYDYYSYLYREIDLLSQLLSAGFSSRLNRALREENGITYTSTSYPIVYSDVGLFLIQMVLNPNELVKGLKILFRELRKTKDELASDEEMVKIVNVTRNETIFSLNKPVDFLTYIGVNCLANRNFELNIKKELVDLKKVTKKDIQDIAKKIFLKEKINLFIYGNSNDTKFDFIKL